MDWQELGIFILRWLHLMVGVAWMGLLYYFNFIQGEYFKEAEKYALLDVKMKLLPRALWWFRWAAVFTLATGGVLLFGLLQQGLINSYMVLAASMGTLMFLNVWLIIWPCQRVVIGEVEGDVASCAQRAALMSRTNTLFSGPMAFGMLGSAHLGYSQSFLLSGEGASTGMWLALLLVALLQINGMFGRLGPLTTTKGVLHSSILLTAVLFSALYF